MDIWFYMIIWIYPDLAMNKRVKILFQFQVRLIWNPFLLGRNPYCIDKNYGELAASLINILCPFEAPISFNSFIENKPVVFWLPIPFVVCFSFVYLKFSLKKSHLDENNDFFIGGTLIIWDRLFGKCSFSSFVILISSLCSSRHFIYLIVSRSIIHLAQFITYKVHFKLKRKRRWFTVWFTHWDPGIQSTYRLFCHLPSMHSISNNLCIVVVTK